MASLSKSYSEQKLQGKVYTPDFIVEKMLDDAGYTGTTLLGKTVLDPACGDGRFLAAAARRIIALSPPETLSANLACLHGWDIDAEAVAVCKKNLSQLSESLDIMPTWNVTVGNALLQMPHLPPSLLPAFDKIEPDTAPQTARFDFIFANPPYIRIQHLEVAQRQFLQKNYAFCKNGSTDIYIAFFELCYYLLSENGTAALITPNTYFYAQTAQTLRLFLIQKGLLRQITNYHALQLFENATTYSAISIFKKCYAPDFIYQEAQSTKHFAHKTIAAATLNTGKVWQLSTQDMERISNGRRLGEICQINVGITTLCDKAYIFELQNNGSDSNLAQYDLISGHAKSKAVWVKTLLHNDVLIERDILKPIVKASTLKNSKQAIDKYILFPYEKHAGKYKIIPEDTLKIRFPLAYKYLLAVKTWLDKRDAGKPNPVAWYAFGRSQGLDSSFGTKILFSPMNKKPNFILYEHEDCTFYSGYCIKYDGDWSWLLAQLNSDRMQQFIATSSRDFRNGWKAYNKKVLEDFEIPQ